MRKSNIVKPTGLKGKDITNRQIELMGIKPLNESNERSVIELTKVGPDGKAYAIVRENHEYYIKVADKTTGLVAEDFQYIGGLKNKKSNVHPSYSKATKQLNLKFLSLNEAFGGEKINVLKNDNLLSEGATAAGSVGFVNKVDADEFVEDKAGEALDYDAKEDKETSGDNVANGKVANDVELTEGEEAIDEMITGEALDAVGAEDSDINNDGVEDEEDDYLTNRRMKIGAAMDSMDEAIAEATGEKIESIIEGLSDSEKEALISALKKKA
jgi:hypothetical protein